MDLQRSLLIGAIAVLSFMLLTEWVAFKDEKTQAQEVQTTRLIANGDTQPAELPQLTESTAAGTDEDLPAVPQAESASEVPVTSQSSKRIVLVRTDSLQLAIDLQGGDIVELALPRHLEQIDNPDVPFVLLEQNDTRTYIAQSGLIGADGIDSKGRAVFTTTANSFEMAEGQDKLIVDLNWQDDSQVKVTKRFTFTRGDYLVQVDYLIENNSDARWQANLFGQIKRDSSAAPASDSGGMGLQPFLGAALTLPDERFAKYDFEDMREKPLKEQLTGERIKAAFPDLIKGTVERYALDHLHGLNFVLGEALAGREAYVTASRLDWTYENGSWKEVESMKSTHFSAISRALRPGPRMYWSKWKTASGAT